jgi:hypothetical protein
MVKICPNYKTCRLVNSDEVVADQPMKKKYVRDYCVKEEAWPSCKRYETKRALWFCPDWVLPDSAMSEEEIIERTETEIENKNSSNQTQHSTLKPQH